MLQILNNSLPNLLRWLEGIKKKKHLILKGLVMT